MQTNGLIYFLVGVVLGSIVVGFVLSRTAPRLPSLSGGSGTVLMATGITQSGAILSGSEDANPGAYLVQIFDGVTTNDDYRKFLNKHGAKKHWLYVVAVKTDNRALWDKFWALEYDTNKIITDAYAKEEDFMQYMSEFYKQVRTNVVSPDGVNDLSIVFSSTKHDISEVLSLCEKTVDPIFFKNLLYIYRANEQNKFCDKIDKKEFPSLFSLCEELKKPEKN